MQAARRSFVAKVESEGMSSSHKMYTFGDDESPAKTGRKHRRGRGYATTNKSVNKKNGGDSSAAASLNSYKQGGRCNYSAAAQRQTEHDKPRAYFTGDACDKVNDSSSSSNDNNGKQTDENDGTGSLTYSESSSMQSAESSTESSFSAILKVIDSSEGGVMDVKEFMARQSQAASGMDDVDVNNPVVTGWIQRREAQKKEPSSSAHSASSNKSSSNVDFNYSRDDSSIEADVYGVEFNEHEENVLETIAG